MFSTKQASKSHWFETWSHFRSIFNGGRALYFKLPLAGVETDGAMEPSSI